MQKKSPFFICRKLAFLLAALVILTNAAFSQHPSVPEKITQTVNGNTETWRIENPNVMKPMTSYQQIVFKPGDQVRVSAGGCVQTGGHGKTWKRYVDPSGPNSNHLYHGKVFVPGAMEGLPVESDPPISAAEPMLTAQGKTFTVKPIAQAGRSHLWLGYEDDGYSDNGYWGHDNGTSDQCKNVGNAYVVVTITHVSTPIPTPTPTASPFDLVLANFDDNGILLNPKWAWQLPPHPQFPDPGNFPNPDVSNCSSGSTNCTTQPTTTDDSKSCKVGGWFGQGTGNGHRNWAPGTYEGMIYWESHSSRIADDDYNIRLVPPNGAGLTTANGVVAATGEKSIEMEFNAGETIDHFDTPWWNQFHQAVDKSFSAASQMISNRYAIATGLIGLDCDHSCATELHPVWAMAIRVNDDPSDEVWAIFIRRWGDEGFCSDNQHYLVDLQGNDFNFRLPWRPGASSFEILPSTVFKSRLGKATGPGITGAPNNSVMVSFILTAPQTGTGEMVHGELHLHWTGASIQALSSHNINFAAIPQKESEDKPEDRFGQLLTKMTPAQRKIFDANTAGIMLKTNSPDNIMLPAAVPKMVASLPKKLILPGSQRPHERAVPDATKMANDQQKLKALHAVYGNTIPSVN